MVHNDAQQAVILVFGFALLIACLAAFAIYSDEGEVAPDVVAPQSSAEVEKVRVECPECHGRGYLSYRLEHSIAVGECPMCGGSGKLIKESDR